MAGLGKSGIPGDPNYKPPVTQPSKDYVFGHGAAFEGTGGIEPDPAPTPWLPGGKTLTNEQKAAAAEVLAGLFASLKQPPPTPVVKPQPAAEGVFDAEAANAAAKTRKAIAIIYDDNSWENV